MNRLARHILLTVALAMLAIAHFTKATEDTETLTTSADIQGTQWWVEDILGGGVIDMSHTTIEFTADGRVAGDTGCNRYTGSVEFTQAEIEFGPMAGTKKACVPALMDQEHRFYRALSKVVRWEVRESGLLHLADADGRTVIRAALTEAEVSS